MISDQTPDYSDFIQSLDAEPADGDELLGNLGTGVSINADGTIYLLVTEYAEAEGKNVSSAYPISFVEAENLARLLCVAVS